MLDFKQKDTIFAPLTPLMPSPICVLRVSGNQALSIKEQLFVPHGGKQDFFKATLGQVMHQNIQLDEALCVAFPKGQSYTGEPCFELSLHGNPLLAQQVMAVLQTLGARLAKPGEFSFRAVQNGKMDLCQAEAVCDLIQARSNEAAQIAVKNLKSGVGKYLEKTRSNLIDILCEIEARLDFPDEDLPRASIRIWLQWLDDAILSLENLLQTAHMGMKYQQGARVVLFGYPNAGKSTLFNTLLGENKALVHERAGTTRDVLEGVWVLEGIPMILLDVAGIREGEDLDPVEAMGIQRACETLEQADLILWLKENENDTLNTYFEKLKTPVIEVYTKSDITAHGHGKLKISARTKEGLETLKQRILGYIQGEKIGDSLGEVMLTKERQKQEVLGALEALVKAKQALKEGLEHEFVAFDLRQSGLYLDRLLGKNLSEDVLDAIYSRFCIGK